MGSSQMTIDHWGLTRVSDPRMTQRPRTKESSPAESALVQKKKARTHLSLHAHARALWSPFISTACENGSTVKSTLKKARMCSPTTGSSWNANCARTVLKSRTTTRVKDTRSLITNDLCQGSTSSLNLSLILLTRPFMFFECQMTVWVVGVSLRLRWDEETKWTWGSLIYQSADFMQLSDSSRVNSSWKMRMQSSEHWCFWSNLSASVIMTRAMWVFRSGNICSGSTRWLDREWGRKVKSRRAAWKPMSLSLPTIPSLYKDTLLRCTRKQLNPQYWMSQLWSKFLQERRMNMKRWMIRFKQMRIGLKLW